MLEEHKNDPLRSSLVFLNTFDYSKDTIEDFMEERRIYAEVFEIDRMRKEDRGEYLNCFNDMFGTKQLPVIFLKDTFVGNFQQLQRFDCEQVFNEHREFMQARKAQTEQPA